jgi:ABC-type uncharacterized transport system permease subunit
MMWWILEAVYSQLGGGRVMSQEWEMESKVMVYGQETLHGWEMESKVMVYGQETLHGWEMESKVMVYGQETLQEWEMESKVMVSGSGCAVTREGVTARGY